MNYTGREMDDIVARHRADQRSEDMLILSAVALIAFVAGLIVGLLA